MADIVVAVTKGSLSILPGLSPMDGGQTEKKCSGRKWS
jgi:hypothetical protein